MLSRITTYNQIISLSSEVSNPINNKCKKKYTKGITKDRNKKINNPKFD